MENVILRGKTYYARYRVPAARWADVGKALGAAGGIKREVVKTLATADPRQAKQRRHEALAAIQAEIDAALRRAGKRPLGSDWTADWMTRAVERRTALETRGGQVIGYHTTANPDEPPEPVLYAEVEREAISDEAEHIAAVRGPDVARQFLNVALGEGMTIAEGRRQWLATLNGSSRRVQTIRGHEAALGKLEVFLRDREGWPSLEGVGIGQVTRRLAGDFLAHCCTLTSPATVKREASAYNGLWRWAVRRGYAEQNPWSDQTAGLGARRETLGPVSVAKRGYTTAELVTLISAGAAGLAPNSGGYAATFWDLIRLLVLTGARPGELLGLHVADVIAGGTAVALATGDGAGKTKNAKRIMPLHEHAQAVIAARLASLPDTSPGASLWPEVPMQGGDDSRTKTIATRFVHIRRRLLPLAKGVDLYSLRRSFQTAAETAKNAGGRIDDGMIARLAGHGQGHLALDVYSDWSRLGRPELSGELLPKLARLSDAVADVVRLGFSADLGKALDDTAGLRPMMLRTAPAFKRSRSFAILSG